MSEDKKQAQEAYKAWEKEFPDATDADKETVKASYGLTDEPAAAATEPAKVTPVVNNNDDKK